MNETLDKFRKEVMIFLAILFLVFVCFCFVGCEGKHCIKVGGSYEGNSGDLEYCYDSSESKYVGLPVLSGAEKSVILTEKQVQKIVEKVEPEKKSMISIGAMKKLSEFLNQSK